MNLFQVLEIRGSESGSYYRNVSIGIEKKARYEQAVEYVKGLGLSIDEGNLQNKFVVGMIWAVILRFTVSAIENNEFLIWCQRKTQGYHNYPIKICVDLIGECDILSHILGTKTTSNDLIAQKVISQINNQKRDFIVNELIQTEVNFINKLLILDNILLSLKDSNILNKTEFNLAFPKIKDLLKVHQQLLEQLQNSASIGKVFLNMIPALSVHKQYTNSQPIAVAKIKEYQMNNPEFQKFLLSTLHAPSSQKWDIFDLLIEPIQRLPRYLLFLNELIKCGDCGEEVAKKPDYCDFGENKNVENVNANGENQCSESDNIDDTLNTTASYKGISTIKEKNAVIEHDINAVHDCKVTTEEDKDRVSRNTEPNRFADLKAAVSELKKLGMSVNQSRKDEESQMKMFELKKLIENSPDDLIKQRRKFICKYDVQEISLTESKVKNIGLFIFNDILLLAKKRKPSIMPFSSSPLKKSKHKYSPSSSSPFTPFGADYSGGVGEYRFLYLVEWTKVNVVTVDENRGYNELLIQLEIFLDVEKNHVIQLGNQSLKSEPVATLKAIDEEYGKRHIHFLRSKEYKEILSVIRKTQFDLLPSVIFTSDDIYSKWVDDNTEIEFHVYHDYKSYNSSSQQSPICIYYKENCYENQEKEWKIPNKSHNDQIKVVGLLERFESKFSVDFRILKSHFKKFVFENNQESDEPIYFKMDDSAFATHFYNKIIQMNDLLNLTDLSWIKKRESEIILQLPEILRFYTHHHPSVPLFKIQPSNIYSTELTRSTTQSSSLNLLKPSLSGLSRSISKASTNTFGGSSMMTSSSASRMTPSPDFVKFDNQDLNGNSSGVARSNSVHFAKRRNSVLNWFQNTVASPKDSVGYGFGLLASSGVIELINVLTSRIERDGLNFDGIYRIKAPKTQVQNLLRIINVKPQDVKESLDKFHIHAIANAFQKWVAKFRNIIFPEAIAEFCLETCRSNSDKLKDVLIDVVSTKLSSTSYIYLNSIIVHLRKVLDHANTNFVTIFELSEAWAPSLIHSKTFAKEFGHPIFPLQSQILCRLIEEMNDIFIGNTNSYITTPYRYSEGMVGDIEQDDDDMASLKVHTIMFNSLRQRRSLDSQFTKSRLNHSRLINGSTNDPKPLQSKLRCAFTNSIVDEGFGSLENSSKLDMLLASHPDKIDDTELKPSYDTSSSMINTNLPKYAIQSLPILNLELSDSQISHSETPNLSNVQITIRRASSLNVSRKAIDYKVLDDDDDEFTDSVSGPVGEICPRNNLDQRRPSNGLVKRTPSKIVKLEDRRSFSVPSESLQSSKTHQDAMIRLFEANKKSLSIEKQKMELEIENLRNQVSNMKKALESEIRYKSTIHKSTSIKDDIISREAIKSDVIYSECDKDIDRIRGMYLTTISSISEAYDASKKQLQDLSELFRNTESELAELKLKHEEVCMERTELKNRVHVLTEEREYFRRKSLTNSIGEVDLTDIN